MPGSDAATHRCRLDGQHGQQQDGAAGPDRDPSDPPHHWLAPDGPGAMNAERIDPSTH